MKAILLARYPDFVKMVLATDETPAECSKSVSGRIADMPNQRVECPLMTHSGLMADQVTPMA